MTTILVVDDEPDMLTLIRIIVQTNPQLGSLAGEATNGAEALDLWRNLPAPSPDVVILDNRMPGLSGLEVAAQMLAERPSQRILLCSANLDSAVRQEAARVGIGCVIDKGDLMALPAAIHSLLATPDQ